MFINHRLYLVTDVRSWVALRRFLQTWVVFPVEDLGSSEAEGLSSSQMQDPEGIVCRSHVEAHVITLSYHCQ